MCYDDQARPPDPPGVTGKAHGHQFVLTSSDGNQFHAYAAMPDSSSETAVVIYPDVRGLHQFYRELALRFAEVGIPAIAIDYFGRTAGLTGREEGFDYMPHVQQVRMDTFTLDVQAAIAYLRDQLGQEARIFVTGFCMGGSLTLLSGTNRTLGFAGLIPFYAGITRDFGAGGAILDKASEVRYPVVGFFGGADQGIPEEAVREIDEKLDSADVDHTIMIYPGAPHSFFDRRSAEYADASSDAWQRLLAFIRTGETQGQMA